MNSVIIYWSRYGHGQKLVDHLSKNLKENDVKTKIFKTSELEPDNIPQADLYVFSTPTEAFRIKRDMRKFMKRIEGLEGKEYGIINTHSMKRNWLKNMEKILKKKKMKKLADVDFKIEKEGAEEERRKSWKKGTEFEETVGNILDSLVYNTTHEVEHVGDEEGEIPGRDVGDHVITLGETGQRIVFESKSEKGYSSQDIKEEMEEALENRDAEYGIFVTECESYVPDKVGYFQEYNQEILSVALSADEDDEIDEGFLHIAWNWARMRTIQSSMEAGETIDTETIQSQVEEIRSDIQRFSTVKTKCSNIEDTAGEIKRLLDEIRDDIHTDLQKITGELSKEGGSASE